MRNLGTATERRRRQRLATKPSHDDDSGFSLGSLLIGFALGALLIGAVKR
jgi:hypothetical protein